MISSSQRLGAASWRRRSQAASAVVAIRKRLSRTRSRFKPVEFTTKGTEGDKGFDFFLLGAAGSRHADVQRVHHRGTKGTEDSTSFFVPFVPFVVNKVLSYSWSQSET